ncbi:MAG TPA: GNAT family N-acetyltransferase [Chloroflexota bacterium]|nr:GNAT family N-acetyltransferase [Chloroflexota bacterium]
MVIGSMLVGNTAGQLWIVQEKSPPLLVLWDKGNQVFYLAGDVESDASLDALRSTVTDQLLPEARAAGVRRFKVRALSPSLETSLPRLFPLPLRPTITRFAVHDTARHRGGPRPHLPGVIFLPITPELLASDKPAGMEYVREEIQGMWPSDDRFHAHGFGILAVAGNEVICWCTAEYVGPTYCGIGIATAEDFQGRGVATAAAGRFVREARVRGLTPCWECDTANIASVRVAEKAGFVRQAEETYWIGSLDVR